ncbi:hypothetical protein HGA34_03430 [Candidatus Falkowbacteria bacterium]|nr:hypothetical protein [Candidatus Falkowbacteria bacterium]
MKKTFLQFSWLLSIILLTSLPLPLLQAEAPSVRLRGRILIQVEQHGEAWYVSPVDDRRYFLGRPADAFSVMRQLGLGISEKDFNGLNSVSKKRLSGRILIRTQKSGEAYYVYPGNLSLNFLGRPADAFNVMRRLGLGITDREINKLPLGFTAQPTSPQPPQGTTTPQNPSNLLGKMEKEIHALINKERTKNGLSALAWNDEVAAVAREHSQNQADENKFLISSIRLCSYPFIHHEGQNFGIYQSERLNSKGIYYFSGSAENIALTPHIKDGTYESTGIQEQDCQGEQVQSNSEYDKRVHQATSTEEKIKTLKAEIKRREGLLENSPVITVLETTYYSIEEVEQKAVTGWMNSPGHRRNILNGEYDEAGMGVAQIKDYFIITQVFIKRAPCGYRNAACCKDERFFYCYEPYSCDEDTLCTEAVPK